MTPIGTSPRATVGTATRYDRDTHDRGDRCPPARGADDPDCLCDCERPVEKAAKAIGITRDEESIVPFAFSPPTTRGAADVRRPGMRGRAAGRVCGRERKREKIRAADVKSLQEAVCWGQRRFGDAARNSLQEVEPAKLLGLGSAHVAPIALLE